jgi:mannose-6-phosphate isomerase-like protein (cupin superfamily)
MITVTTRQQLRIGENGTAKFVGADHGSGVSFFWVDVPLGSGPGLHKHPYTETWVVLKGEALVETPDGTHRATPGEIITVSADTPHRFVSSSSERLEMVCIHASPTMIQQDLEAGD